MGCGSCRGGKVLKLDQPSIAPIMNEDTSVVYPEGYNIPDIEGYQVDPNNPQKMIPLENIKCAYKITGINLQKDGTYAPIYICRHDHCEYQGKQVSNDICKECPLRSLTE